MWKITIRHMALMLLDGPADKKQLRQCYTASAMLSLGPEGYKKQLEEIESFEYYLDYLRTEGYILEENGLYRLTEKGSAFASNLNTRLSHIVEVLSSGLWASYVSVLVNVVLTAVSLAAGVLTNSMGLMSSGLDSLVSVFTSAAAYFGIKYRAETVANVVIIVIIALVSLFLGYESLNRLFNPEPFDSGILPILAAIFSGIVCWALAVFQHYMGNHSRKLSLIILSVDNFNSVYISLAVLVGIIFARFGIMIVDPLVSLAITVIMLKSAFDLGMETLKSADGSEPDLSRYDFKRDKVVKQWRKDRFKFWSLYLLREPKTREELEGMFSIGNAKSFNYVVIQMGPDMDYSKHCGGILDELMASSLIAEAEGKYCLTTAGERSVSDALAAPPVWQR